MRVTLAVTSLAAALAGLYVPEVAHAQGVVWIHDGRHLPEHRLRGETRAEADLKTGVLKLYVPVCTFATPDRKHIRTFEIRKALYGASGVKVMADLCNDLIPDAFQQEAFVAGYNSVMDKAIVRRLGQGWKEAIEKQVERELRMHPKGVLRAADIEFETPY